MIGAASGKLGKNKGELLLVDESLAFLQGVAFTVDEAIITSSWLHYDVASLPRIGPSLFL